MKTKTTGRRDAIAKSSKKLAAPGLPIVPRVGDKVLLPGSGSPLEITYVYYLGCEVNLQLPGTNLEWFRVKAESLTYVERKPPAKTSNPFTHPKPVIDDADEALDRIDAVRGENLDRLDG
jgi:hypothetical protein